MIRVNGGWGIELNLKLYYSLDIREKIYGALYAE